MKLKKVQTIDPEQTPPDQTLPDTIDYWQKRLRYAITKLNTSNKYTITHQFNGTQGIYTYLSLLPHGRDVAERMAKTVVIKYPLIEFSVTRAYGIPNDGLNTILINNPLLREPPSYRHSSPANSLPFIDIVLVARHIASKCGGTCHEPGPTASAHRQGQVSIGMAHRHLGKPIDATYAYMLIVTTIEDLTDYFTDYFEKLWECLYAQTML